MVHKSLFVLKMRITTDISTLTITLVSIVRRATNSFWMGRWFILGTWKDENRSLKQLRELKVTLHK